MADARASELSNDDFDFLALIDNVRVGCGGCIDAFSVPFFYKHDTEFTVVDHSWKRTFARTDD